MNLKKTFLEGEPWIRDSNAATEKDTMFENPTKKKDYSTGILEKVDIGTSEQNPRPGMIWLNF
eukprot:UN18125